MVQVLRRTLSCFVISAAFGKKAARKESEKISERAISSEKAGKSVSPGSKGDKETWAPTPKTPARRWGILYSAEG
jgi:hypothetical protein